MMKCPDCGAKLDDDGVCAKCGYEKPKRPTRVRKTAEPDPYGEWVVENGLADLEKARRRGGRGGGLTPAEQRQREEAARGRGGGRRGKLKRHRARNRARVANLTRRRSKPLSGKKKVAIAAGVTGGYLAARGGFSAARRVRLGKSEPDAVHTAWLEANDLLAMDEVGVE